MIESYKQAIEEFKRVEHLFHVSLKYTRTVDVIKSVMERMIATFEQSIDSLLKCLKEEKKIIDIPTNPIGKAMLIKEQDPTPEIVSKIDMYLKLRRMVKLEYTKREEFRRHVTMTVNLDGEKVDIDIDKLEEYYNETRLFLIYTKNKVSPYHNGNDD